MTDLCKDRVVLVNGGAGGIGYGISREFARQGATVVVNDIGAQLDGTGHSLKPAESVVDEIRAMGGRAIAAQENVADWDAAKRLVDTTVSECGRLDVLVNVAGVLRDRMLANMSAEEWDAVIRVHLRGTFAPMRHAAAYWRDQAKAGNPVDARVINTSSTSGVYGNVGQTNYGAAKAGVAAMTIISAMELQRYSVTVNAITPGARTRMTESVFPAPDPMSPLGRGFDDGHPDNVAPLVVWLGSPASRDVTGRVFDVRGGQITVLEGWSRGPSASQDKRWDPAELGEIVPGLVQRAAPNADMRGQR